MPASAVLSFDKLNELVIPLDVGLLGVVLMPNLPKLPYKLLFNFHDNPPVLPFLLPA